MPFYGQHHAAHLFPSKRMPMPNAAGMYRTPDSSLTDTHDAKDPTRPMKDDDLLLKHSELRPIKIGQLPISQRPSISAR